MDTNLITKPTIDHSFKLYYEQLEPTYISWDFYKEYVYKEPKFGDIGLIVFLRTYSRFIAKLNRREKWAEVVLRVVEYSLSLYEKSPEEQLSYIYKKKEAEELFDAIFNLRIFPAGRTLWTGGTAQTNSGDDSSNWNCCGIVIDQLSAFPEVFYWLLIGAGVGFSVERKYISNLPNLNTNVKLIHEPYIPKSKRLRNEHTQLFIGSSRLEVDMEYLCQGNTLSSTYLGVKEKLQENEQVRIEVGDSKEGWCNALKLLLYIMADSKSSCEILINYNSIRLEGERLEKFGGRSSGHHNLQIALENIHRTILENEGILSSTVCLDIVTWSAWAVVSGGIRRSALIAIGDEEDEEFIKAKYNLYQDPKMAKYIDNRRLSNNSINMITKPDRDTLVKVFENIKSNGEPGFWTINHARKADPDIVVTNPCGEAGLRNRQTCNLVTVNLTAYAKNPEYKKRSELWGDDLVDWRLLYKDLRLITRCNARVTLGHQWHTEWDKVQKSQRLMGVSVTGYCDFLLALQHNSLKKFTKKELNEFEVNILASIRTYVNVYEKEFSKSLKLESSSRITLVKPEGTISQLPTVSSGLHQPYAPYYLRRVRFSKIDPLAKVLIRLGLPYIEDSVDTIIFTFPIATHAEKASFDEPVEDQLDRYKRFMKHYVSPGHNASCTITVADDEWDKAIDWLHKNWNETIGVSFLGKFDTTNEPYPSMPYKACTKEEYLKYKSITPTFKENELLKLLSEYEYEAEHYELLDSECTTGCPTR